MYPVAVFHHVGRLRNCVLVAFDLLCTAVLVMGKRCTERFSLTGNLLLLETDDYQADRAHAEDPGGE